MNEKKKKERKNKNLEKNTLVHNRVILEKHKLFRGVFGGFGSGIVIPSPF